MARLKNYIILLFVLCCLMTWASINHVRLYSMSGHKLVLVDTRSPRADIDRVLSRANLIGLNAGMLLDRQTLPENRFGWHLSRVNDHTVRIDLPADAQPADSKVSPFDVSDDNVLQTGGQPGYPADVAFGVNNFARITVRELPSGLTRFFLPGQTDKRRVQLSGSFNNWTTMKGLMTRTDSGWVSDLKLDPGPYAYKYIINGRWTRDESNNLKEHDGWGGYNSIYFRYNYTFKLAGYNGASRVIVAGSFNNWNANQLIMAYKDNRWQLPLYLHEGTHLYRFMVDGKWISDPANKATSVRNNEVNSVLSFGENTNFKLAGHTDAHNVYVAGSFNNWRPNVMRMQRTANGWVLPYTLPGGNYEYKFVVDGNWMTDPSNPHTITTDETNSVLAVRPNHTFVLRGYNNARSVSLSGTFNGWNEPGYAMQRVGNDWVISLNLKPGKHLYKFVINGHDWILDPGNKQWEQNEHATGNSVLWMGN
ncbi:hypothetical protein LLH06_06755 [Mucilaginibacter daejeonensis]|uniref:hypothetical protein n=1 Tax=Mucilaginibacter daejeonensis TaxID=398049 RepID=UPI001D173BD1|nr:hypothetical protein [Mucilaginibacter daejeonensis]UEG54659.1 hypothetical protein LLH06_06755 [Mucilaginibacter daejeonensis]